MAIFGGATGYVATNFLVKFAKRMINRHPEWREPVIRQEDVTLVLTTDEHFSREPTPYINTPQSLSKLRDVVKHVGEKPDAFATLGDNINKFKDTRYSHRLYFEMMGVFSMLPQFPHAFFGLLGNHDYDALSLNELLNIQRHFGLNKSSYGVQNIRGIQFAWVNPSSINPNKHGYLSEEILNFLNLILDQPTVILSHYPFIPFPKEECKHFKGNHLASAYTNGPEIWSRIPPKKKKNIIVVLSGHAHTDTDREIDGVRMITLPPFSEGHLPSNDPEKHPPDFPAPYTIVSFQNDKFTRSTFVQGYYQGGRPYPYPPHIRLNILPKSA